jgi:predicted ATPase
MRKRGSRLRAICRSRSDDRLDQHVGLIRCYLLGEGSTLEEQATRLFAYGADKNFQQMRRWVRIYLGNRAAINGDVFEGLSMLGGALAEFEQMGFTFARSHYLCVRAEAILSGGDLAGALATLDEAREHGERTGEQIFRAEVKRRIGDVLCLQGHFDEAQAHYEEAISFAKKQEAKLFELRAATSLAKLFREQGRKDVARDTLAPVYDGFAEGFDTPPLKEAEALLDSVSTHVPLSHGSRGASRVGL